MYQAVSAWRLSALREQAHIKQAAVSMLFEADHVVVTHALQGCMATIAS
jgi:hypothetical protein